MPPPLDPPKNLRLWDSLRKQARIFILDPHLKVLTCQNFSKFNVLNLNKQYAKLTTQKILTGELFFSNSDPHHF